MLALLSVIFAYALGMWCLFLHLKIRAQTDIIEHESEYRERMQEEADEVLAEWACLKDSDSTGSL